MWFFHVVDKCLQAAWAHANTAMLDKHRIHNLIFVFYGITCSTVCCIRFIRLVFIRESGGKKNIQKYVDNNKHQRQQQRYLMSTGTRNEYMALIAYVVPQFGWGEKTQRNTKKHIIYGMWFVYDRTLNINDQYLLIHLFDVLECGNMHCDWFSLAYLLICFLHQVERIGSTIAFAAKVNDQKWVTIKLLI